MFQKNAAAVRGSLRREELLRDEEEEDGPMPARGAVPRGGLSYYQAPPPFMSTPLSHPGARQHQQQPTPAQHQGASHSAASGGPSPVTMAAASAVATSASVNVATD